MGEMRVTIQRARPERLPEIREVFLDSALYDRYFSRDDRLDKILAEAAGKGDLWLAVNSRDEVVGAMQMELTGFFGAFPYLALLGVKKNYRGMGVGHTLLRVFEGVAREKGYRKASLLVSHFNPRARALYQSMGYKRVGYVPDAILPGIHENIMVKDL